MVAALGKKNLPLYKSMPMFRKKKSCNRKALPGIYLQMSNDNKTFFNVSKKFSGWVLDSGPVIHLLNFLTFLTFFLE